MLTLSDSGLGTWAQLSGPDSGKQLEQPPGGGYNDVYLFNHQGNIYILFHYPLPKRIYLLTIVSCYRYSPYSFFGIYIHYILYSV